jgi:hypothetical protein
VSAPLHWIGTARFRFGGHDVVASLFRPGTWHLEGLEDSEDVEFVVLDVLRKQFDPRKDYRGPSDGVYGCSTVDRAARFFGGTAEVRQ